MRSSQVAVALVVLAACGRRFEPAPQPPSAATSPPRVAAADPASAFAGQRVVLTGNNWGARAEDNVVRVGDARAQVLSVDAATLTVLMPDLGSAPHSAAVAVTVGRLTGVLATPMRYRGPGHSTLSTLRLAANVSAQPAVMAVSSNLVVVTTTRQDQTEIFDRNLVNQQTYFDDPSLLPLRGFLTSTEWWTLGHRSLDFSDPAELDGAPLPASLPIQFDEQRLAGVRFAEAVVGQRGPIAIGDGSGAALTLGLTTPVEASLVAPDPLIAGADQVLVVTAADGGHAVWLFEVPATGPATLTVDRPLVLPASTELGPVALKPDGSMLLVLAQSALATQVFGVPLGVDGGDPAPLTSLIDPMGAVAASDSYFAVAPTGEPFLRTYQYDGTFMQLLSLASPAIAVVADAQPPHDAYILQATPPEVLHAELRADNSGLVDLRLLRQINAGLGVAAINPSGTRFAVATKVPCQLAVTDAATLEVPSRGGMSTGAAPGTDSTNVSIAALVWPTDDWVCGLIDGLTPVCSRDNGFFAPHVCTMPIVLPDGHTSRLSTDGQGTLFVSKGSLAMACDLRGACPTTCASTFLDGQVSERFDFVAFTPDGQHALGTDTEVDLLAIQAFSVDAGIGLTEQIIRNGIAFQAAVHPTRPLGLVAAQPTSVLIDLDTGLIAATFDTESGNARSGGFSPDGSRVYLGTELGDLLSYDLAALPSDGGLATLAPESVLHAPFSIDTLVVDPAGARLIVFPSSSPTDQLWVAQ